MFLRQIFDPHLAQYAYLIGCQRSGEALVIDPLRDVDQYREIAAAEGLRLSAVAETHIHADFVSGARQLSECADVFAYLSAEGGADWQSEWAKGKSNTRLLHHGSVFRIGNIKLEAIHTPGHTPEHLCFLITDEGGGADEPIALVSGDFLFVGDVGRPDLLEQAAGQAGTQEAGAHQLYQSLQLLNGLPDFLQILPAHGAGSACGKSLGAVPVSTLGYEKKFNPALRLALTGKEQEFVDYILDGQPEPPLYFGNMKLVNRAGPAIRDGAQNPRGMRVPEITPELVILDTRSEPSAFAAGHLKGSLHAPMRGDFSGFAGSCLSPDDEIALVVESAGDVQDLTNQLFRIGFDHVRGWVNASELGDDLTKLPSIKFDQLENLLAAKPDAIILDVRRAGEFSARHLRGAVNIAHTRLRARSDELPPERKIIVHCQSGKRAATSAAWLLHEGRDVVFVNDAFTHAPESLLG
jgi:hydroxyacylglutathione hydrolase